MELASGVDLRSLRIPTCGPEGGNVNSVLAIGGHGRLDVEVATGIVRCWWANVYWRGHSGQRNGDFRPVRRAQVRIAKEVAADKG